LKDLTDSLDFLCYFADSSKPYGGKLFLLLKRELKIMSLEEIEILKERALKFLKNAEYLLQNKVLDLAAFNIQQFVELYLKYKLFLLVGDYSKTHSIKRLLKEIGKASNKEAILREFMEQNIDRISNIENAYITSRYIPSEFEMKEVENMFELGKKIVEFVDEL